ncbi:carboxypeptidase A1-like isoform X2 [Aricia agestis]|uniref:carboxypeptidase A1-like isoform X2 n=1 Tax=Aricia agestis TaxID=91739 RepID=UPI001C202F9E|nr:carboxypeptidase A1-like isoform X2 [Aricia agestis]
MARRLALLALLVCAAAALRPLASVDSADSDSMDPFTLWEEFDDTVDSGPLSRRAPAKHKTKVILKPPPKSTSTRRPATAPPKVNATTERGSVRRTNSTGDSDKKRRKVVKTTINIASHTNFIVTDRVPIMFPVYHNYSSPTLPLGVIKIEDQSLWVNNVLQGPMPTEYLQQSDKLAQSQAPAQQLAPTTARPRASTRPRPATTRRTTTRRTTARPTQKANKKRRPCTQSPGFLDDYFRENRIQKAPKKEEKSGFLSGIISWISPWFSGGWFSDSLEQKSTSTTTTPYPPSTSTEGWFQNLLNSEENEEPNSDSPKKPRKKSLKKNYKGYQLLRTYADAQWKVRALLDLQEDAEGSGVMWWTPPSLGSSTDLLVPPDLLVDVKEQLKSSSIEYDVVIWDLQKAIMYENPKLSKKQRLELEHVRGHPMTWRRYHRYADILRYLEYLQHSHTDLVELVPLGRSSEGLPLIAVKVSKGVNETRKNGTANHKKKYKLRSNMKPAVWIDGGTHACEWIAPAVATWILHHLVEGDKSTGNDQDILKLADFYILPVLNPDGYEHTHTHDRLWKKTRSQNGDRSDDYYISWFPWNWGRTECVGVDADRNWDFHWGEKDSSRDQCADNYAGQQPFSEPETRAVSEFLADRRGQIKVFISLHAYSQSWLLPSTHANTPFSDDGTMMEMGKLATAALADMYGTKYKVGTVDELQQPASGMSHDWAKARAGIKYSYHVDLRDSFGPYGFLLPGSQIVSTAKETWQAVKTIVENLE